VQMASDSGSVGLIFWGSVFKSTGASRNAECYPRALLLRPLSTTFVHSLRLNRLLSTIKLLVIIVRLSQRAKALDFVVYGRGDRYKLGLDT
jgi:hypothetical protein